MPKREERGEVAENERRYRKGRMEGYEGRKLMEWSNKIREAKKVELKEG